MGGGVCGVPRTRTYHAPEYSTADVAAITIVGVLRVATYPVELMSRAMGSNRVLQMVVKLHDADALRTARMVRRHALVRETVIRSYGAVIRWVLTVAAFVNVGGLKRDA